MPVLLPCCSPKHGDGRGNGVTLAITSRAWQIENVAVGARPGAVPSEEYARRRAIDLARINAARAIVSGSQGWQQDFVWPAIAVRIDKVKTQ